MIFSSSTPAEAYKEVTMKQFSTILGYELKSFFKNKVFMGTTIFLAIAIAIVMFIPSISAAISSDTPEDNTEKEIMLVSTELESAGEMVRSIFAEAFTDYEVRLTNLTDEQIKTDIKDGNAACAFVLASDFSYTYYVDNLSMYDMNSTIAEELLQSVYRMSAMISGGLSPEQASDIMAVRISGRVENLGVDQMENYWYTYIMIFALYMVIMLYGQMAASNVATEKSSRAMELLITSAKPTAMMFGKVIASCLAGLIQLLTVFGSAILFYNINKAEWGDIPIMASIFDMPPMLLFYMLVFFILGFLIYAFLYGAIGSTASKLEDINTSVMPLTFLFIFAFILVMGSMSSGSVDNTLMIVCSYIPFTSPMAMFTRIAMSTVPVYEILISMAVLIASVVGVGIVSAKIYRVGVLLYGTPPKIGAIIKALRKG